jgi:hypothetical protein
MRFGLAFGIAIFSTLAANPIPALAPAALAQDQPQAPMVDRSAKGAAAMSIQVGIYLNVQPDCTSGTLPAIRLVDPPANGTVSIKRGKVSATNYKECLALEVPGLIAFYQSKADFVGTDTVILEIKYPQGRTEMQRIKIEIGGGGATPASGRAI